MQPLISTVLFYLLFSSTLAAQQAPVERATVSAANVAVAEAYLSAYSTFSTSRMAPFYTDDATFEDLTSSTQNAAGGPFVFKGKQAILHGLGDYVSQYQAFTVNYAVERRYESNGIVVFIAQLSYQLKTKGGKSFAGTAPIVTAITVRNGKVARHVDFYDYLGNAVEFGDAQ